MRCYIEGLTPSLHKAQTIHLDSLSALESEDSLPLDSEEDSESLELDDALR